MLLSQQFKCEHYLLNEFHHFFVGVTIIRLKTKRENLPKYHTISIHVGLKSKLAVQESFRCQPANGKQGFFAHLKKTGLQFSSRSTGCLSCRSICTAHQKAYCSFNQSKANQNRQTLYIFLRNASVACSPTFTTWLQISSFISSSSHYLCYLYSNQMITDSGLLLRQ